MTIKLSPIDYVDVGLLQEWQNDTKIKYPIMGFRFPIQRETVQEWLENLKTDNGKHRVVYGIFDKTQPVGMISLHNIDYVNSHASIGIYIASNDKQSKGIGFTAMNLVLDFAFNAMGLNRIELEVLEKNDKAIKLYHKCGFQNEGTKRQGYFIAGEFANIQIMSLLKDEFTFDCDTLIHRLV